MAYTQSSIAKMIPGYNYIHVVCEKCGSACEMDYKGLDSSVPCLQIVCPSCGDLGTWKLWHHGTGFLDYVKKPAD